MRPVNLIPPEQRRGEEAPTRTGPLAYIIVGALAAILVGVTAIVMLGNSLEDKEAEVASLEAQAAETSARASALAPYVEFQSLRDARVQTVDSLARSRYDWERVIRELSRVIPSTVWLNNMTGSASPTTQVPEAAGVALRSNVAGPAVELTGCARTQKDIARLISAIDDVDGVTRVTAVNGIKADGGSSESGGAEGAASSGDGGECAPSAPAFELVAALEPVAAPETTVPPVTSGGGAVPTVAGGPTLSPGG